MTSSSSSSSFKPKLTDQEYLELVFENGEIKAKSQRSNVTKNQRTKSIMDLYELEYNEDEFKKTIKNHHHVPNMEKVESFELFIPPDEQSVVVERSIGLSFDSFFSSTGFTEDSEESRYSSLDDDDDDESARTRVVVPARTRKRRSDSSESKQRNAIDKRMRTLQNLLPNSHKDDNESLLDETINYMTNLQHQVQMMKMNNGFVIPSMILPPLVPMCVPQFLIAPMENCSPQSVPLSCVATYHNPCDVTTTYTIDHETLKNLKKQ